MWPFKKDNRDNFSCKWIEPSKYGWWEWQSCHHPDHKDRLCAKMAGSPEPYDVSCNFKGCTLFEDCGERWVIKKDVVVGRRKK
jgi:hypothetical protein